MTNTLKAWIVTASRGEWSDREEWNVRGFTDEARAKAFCDRIGAVAREAAQRFLVASDEDDSLTTPWEERQLVYLRELWELDPDDPLCREWEEECFRYRFQAPTYKLDPIEIDVGAGE